MNDNAPDVVRVAFLAVLAITVAWGFSRRAAIPRTSMRFALAGLLAAPAVVASFLAFRSAGETFVMMHEGGSEQLLNLLVGRPGHAGPLLRGLIAPLLDDTTNAGPRAVLGINLAATTLTAGLLAAIAAARTGSWGLALATTYLWSQHIAVYNAAYSETGGPLGTLLTVVAMAVLGLTPKADEAAPGWFRGASVVLVGAWGALAASARTELIVIAVLLTAAALTKASTTPQTWHDARRRLEARIGGSHRLRIALATAIVLLLPLSRLQYLSDDPKTRWAIIGLSGLWPSFFGFFSWLVYSSNLIWALLGILGAVISFRRPVYAGLMGVAAIVLARVWVSASHNHYYEMVRYSLPLLAPFALAAADGAAFARDRWFTAEQWSVWRVPLAVLVYVSLSIPPPNGLATFMSYAYQPVEGERTRRELHLDTQREAKFLVQQLEALGEPCTVSLRAWPDVSARVGRAPPESRRLITIPGGRVAAPDQLAESERRRMPACTVYLWSLDCNLQIAGDTCNQDIVGAELLAEQHWPTMPYNATYEYGVSVPMIRVALYRMPHAH